MPILHFKDGKKVRCGYQDGSIVHKILTGQATSDEVFDSRILKIVEQTQSVDFEDLPQPKGYSPTKDIVHDDKLKELINGNLKGYAKFQAIGNYLKARQMV